MSKNIGRIVVAMSGGVDSSVAAAILKKQGYDVVGMMLRLWSEKSTADNRCCTPDAVDEARMVADQLDIPFYVLDYREQFKKEVVDYFTAVYSSGMTPNPCLLCNKKIRFGGLLNEALELGATHLVTGHYVQVKEDAGRYQLFKGKDNTKDQSYVLYQLDQKQLSHVLFPLGDMEKTDTRRLANEFNLQVAGRKDSMDLCFIGDEDYRGFLGRHAPTAFHPGDIVNMQGEKLGRHKGLPNYTIGQRRGLGISGSEPYYVIELDMEQNLLRVGVRSERGHSHLHAAEMNYLDGSDNAKPAAVWVKTRYTAQPVHAKMTPLPNNEARFDFEQPLMGITPGQAAVFYDQDRLLGGGIIQRRRV